MKKINTQGFTLIELLMIITLLGVIAGFVYSFAVPKYRERTYYTRGLAELNTMGNALNLYVAKYNDFPPDVTRDVPSTLKEFVQAQQDADNWPNAPWPNSVYDYDNWPPDANGPNQTYQISVRFCAQGDNVGCKAYAQKYLSGTVPAATLANWDSYSSIYYCVKGSCRAHQNKPLNHPGYCINCGTSAKPF